jgi:hypothetical protein
MESHDSSVGTATFYGLDGRGTGFRVHAELRISASPYRPDRLCGPPKNPVGTGGSFPGVKRPGRESDHSPPTTAEVEETLVCTSAPPISLQCIVFK